MHLRGEAVELRASDKSLVEPFNILGWLGAAMRIDGSRGSGGRRLSASGVLWPQACL